MINDVIKVWWELYGIENYPGVKVGFLYVNGIFAHNFVAAGVNLRMCLYLRSRTSGNNYILY